MTVIIYSIDPCPYCFQAKQLLTLRNIPFEEIKMDRNDAVGREALQQKSGMKTFPVIFAGDNLIGGYSQLKERDDQDQLSFLK